MSETIQEEPSLADADDVILHDFLETVLYFFGELSPAAQNSRLFRVNEHFQRQKHTVCITSHLDLV